MVNNILFVSRLRNNFEFVIVIITFQTILLSYVWVTWIFFFPVILNNSLQLLLQIILLNWRIYNISTNFQSLKVALIYLSIILTRLIILTISLVSGQNLCFLSKLLSIRKRFFRDVTLKTVVDMTSAPEIDTDIPDQGGPINVPYVECILIPPLTVWKLLR